MSIVLNHWTLKCASIFVLRGVLTATLPLYISQHVIVDRLFLLRQSHHILHWLFTVSHEELLITYPNNTQASIIKCALSTTVSDFICWCLSFGSNCSCERGNNYISHRSFWNTNQQSGLCDWSCCHLCPSAEPSLTVHIDLFLLSPCFKVRISWACSAFLYLPRSMDGW